MTFLERFLHFWYDFIVGDDWSIAAGVIVGLGLTWVLVQSGINAWWLMPLAVAIVLGISLWREVSQVETRNSNNEADT